jgi:hypothetical protein
MLMALGMTRAVILFSIVLISLNGSTIWESVYFVSRVEVAHVGDPAKNIGVETDMVLRDIQSPLYQDIFRQRTSVVCYQLRTCRGRYSLPVMR